MADMIYRIPKFRSMGEFWEWLPDDEREIVDVLRQIVIENLPGDTVEKFAYNVPNYYGKRRICIIWPASVPRGGIKTGVLLGFFQGYRLADVDNYLTHGANKVVFYKIYRSVDQIDERAIVKLLQEAAALDSTL
jgi:Domain of unknown function (DU1801)